MQSGLNQKKLKELLQELVSGKSKAYDGGKAKISDEVLQVFSVCSKIFCGQLTEEARLVQIEELALYYGGYQYVPEKLGPIKPVHLQEARRRLIKQGILIPP